MLATALAAAMSLTCTPADLKAVLVDEEGDFPADTSVLPLWQSCSSPAKSEGSVGSVNSGDDSGERTMSWQAVSDAKAKKAKERALQVSPSPAAGNPSGLFGGPVVNPPTMGSKDLLASKVPSFKAPQAPTLANPPAGTFKHQATSEAAPGLGTTSHQPTIQQPEHPPLQVPKPPPAAVAPVTPSGKTDFPTAAQGAVLEVGTQVTVSGVTSEVPPSPLCELLFWRAMVRGAVVVQFL